MPWKKIAGRTTCNHTKHPVPGSVESKQSSRAAWDGYTPAGRNTFSYCNMLPPTLAPLMAHPGALYGRDEEESFYLEGLGGGKRKCSQLPLVISYPV